MSGNEELVQPADASGANQPRLAPPAPDMAALGEETTEGSVHEYRLSAPGEVITKEQNNASRQISYLSRLLSQRHSLGKSRKYPILGTDRELSVKQHFNKIVGEAGSQNPAAALHAVPRGGANTDIYSTFASRDVSAGTLQANSPAVFMEPKHVSMAGLAAAGANTKYLAAHRRGGSFSGTDLQDPQQQLAYLGQYNPAANFSTVPYREEQVMPLVGQGSLPNFGQVIMSPQQVPPPLLVQQLGQLPQTQSVLELPPGHGQDPALQIQKLHERSMAALQHLSQAELQASATEMSGLAPEGMPGQALGAQQNAIQQNNFNSVSRADTVAGAGAAGGGPASVGKGASSMGLNSTRLVRLGHRNQGAGESELEAPVATQMGPAKYPGDQSLHELLDQDYAELLPQPGHHLPGQAALTRIETDGTQLGPHGHQDYLQPQHLEPILRNPEGAILQGPQRTHSFFNLHHVGSQQLQPGTAQHYQEQLESWTAKSSVVGDAKQARVAPSTKEGTFRRPGLIELEHTGFSQSPFGVKDLAQAPYIVQDHAQMAPSMMIAGPGYGHSRMNLQSQSVRLQSKAHHVSSAAMRVRLEKQEIDKLLKKVRERKRVSLVRDPSIRLDEVNRSAWPRKWSVQQTPSQRRFADNEQFVLQNPIVVTGIKRRSGQHIVPPLKVPDLQLNQPFEQIDQTLYARDAPLNRTLEAPDTNQKIRIQDRFMKQESGMLPGLDPTSQRVISTESLLPDAVYQHFLSAQQVQESTQRIIEVTADHASAEDGQSENIKFHFGTKNNDALKNAPGLAGDQKKRMWNMNQNDVSSTAAGQSAQVIEHTASGVALNADLKQPSVVQLQSPQIEAFVDSGSDLRLNQQMSKQSFVLATQTGPKRKRMSLPRIKQVFVSPNLRVGGMSARQRSILQSQKQLATLKRTRMQAQIQSDRFLTGGRRQSVRLFPPQDLQQLPEEYVEEHFSPPNAGLQHMQSQDSIQQVLFAEPLSGAISSDVNKDTRYTQAASLASLAPAYSRQSDNFFVAIEQLPHLPLKVKLQAKDLIRNLERQIRLKQTAIEKQKKENEAGQRVYEHLNETKKKLKKAAKDIVVYQKKQEREAEKERKEAIAVDPDLDEKRQLEREMEELERQIRENEERIVDRQAHLVQEAAQLQDMGDGLGGSYVDVQAGQTPEGGPRSMDAMGGQGQEQPVGVPVQPSQELVQNQILENATGAPQHLEAGPGKQEQMQNDPAAAIPALPPQHDQEELQQQMQEGQAPPQYQARALSIVTPPMPGKIQSAGASPIKEEEILEAPEEEQEEEARPFAGLEDSPLPDLDDSPFPRIATEEPLPGLLQEALIDKAAERMKQKPQRTVEERQIQANHAEIETRIYKLYRDYTQNDLKREKKNTLVALRKVKMEGQIAQDELRAVVERNEHLKKTIKRYKSLVENFESEHENLQKFLIEKREETTVKRKKEEFQHMKKKINSKRRAGEFDAGGTISPHLGQAEVRGSIKAAEFLSHREQHADASQGSRGSLAQGIEAAKGGTLPKTNLKVVQPRGVLLGADFSAPSERPDGTTVSLGSISARGDQEKIRVQALEKLFHSFKQAQRTERALDVALQVMDVVKASFGCTKITLFAVDFYTANVLQVNVSKEKKNYLRQVSYIDESENIQRQFTAVSRSPEELCDQILFKSLKNVGSDVRLTNGGTQFAVLIRQSTAGRTAKASSQEAPAHGAPEQQKGIASPPEIANKHEPAFILQGEIPELAQNESPRKAAQRQPAERKQPPLKLNYTSLMSIQLLCMGVQLKLERLRLTHALRGKGSSEEGELIQMIGRIYKHKNLKALMSGLSTEISTFFNFKDISIMFHDEEKNQLYTITYGDQEDKEMAMREKRANAESSEELAVLDAVTAMNDLTLPANQLIYFPISVGISSMVFKQQRAMYFNNFNRVNNIYFVNEIDNVQCLEQIDNLLVAHTTRDDGTSNGLIQLYNHPMLITETHRKKLEAISRFFGACIQNIEDTTKKITAMLAVQLDPGESQRWLKTSMDAVKQSELEYCDLLKPIERIEGALAKNEAENEEIISGTIPEKRLKELLEGP